MKHGVHRIDLLVEGDVLEDGWQVVETIGDGDYAWVTVREPGTGNVKNYRLPRDRTVEVNKH